MNPARSINRRFAYPGRRRQRGDALLESMIGVVISSAMGLGLAFTASRMMVSQRYVTTQSAVLDQMTSSLATTGVSALCAGTSSASVTVGSSTLALGTPTCTQAAISVGALGGGVGAVALTPGVVTTMSFATPTGNSTATTLLGGNGVMTISE